MKTNNYSVPMVPTANVAVNKSRIKLYTKNVDMPTYYLEKGQEFQLELFNPTSYVVLAQILLNGKKISQGGLVLNPGQRVFLERYIDVPNKFMFDTYEVSNTSEVIEAIKNNGDIEILFYKEIELPKQFFRKKWYDNEPWTGQPWTGQPWTGQPWDNSGGYYYGGTTNISDTSNGSYYTNMSFTSSLNSNIKAIRSISKKSKSIETGRVEMGSSSDQKFKTVNKSFEQLPFHTINYKLMPLSQKINTVGDISVKRYCTNCGHKMGKTDKFCGQCGTKV